MRAREKKQYLREHMLNFQAWIDAQTPHHEYHTERTASRMAAAALSIYEDDQRRRAAQGKDSSHAKD